MKKIKISSEYGYNRVLTNQDNLPIGEVDENDLALIGKTKKFIIPVPVPIEHVEQVVVGVDENGDNITEQIVTLEYQPCVTDMSPQEIAEKEARTQAWQAEADKQARLQQAEAERLRLREALIDDMLGFIVPGIEQKRADYLALSNEIAAARNLPALTEKNNQKTESEGL